MKLQRDLSIGQKAAWFFAHGLRRAWEERQPRCHRRSWALDRAYGGAISGSSGAMPGPHDPNQSGNPHQEEIRDQAIEQDPRRAE